MSSLPSTIMLLPLAAYSTYTLYLSKENIDRLLSYEREAERAAEWSTTAAERLRKTRTTQAAGVLSLTFSLLTSLTLFFLPAPTSTTYRLPLAALNTVILAAGSAYMSGFWNERTQTKVPFVDKFNEAIRGSEREVTMIGELAGAWAALGCAWWWIG